MSKQQKTSWESSAKWYDEAVGEKGHYYHEHVILPNLLKSMELAKSEAPKVLDIACGQGILARQIPKGVPYLGIDISPTLIQSAKERADKKHHRFQVQDATKQMALPERDFTHAMIILALQNIADPLQVLKNIEKHLAPGGSFSSSSTTPVFVSLGKRVGGSTRPKNYNTDGSIATSPRFRSRSRPIPAKRRRFKPSHSTTPFRAIPNGLKRPVL